MCIYRNYLCGLVVWAVVAGSFPGLAQQSREVSIDGLIYDLAHPDGDRRKAAAKVLDQHKAARAVPGLIELTEDPDGLIRMVALRALVGINDPSALDTYVRLTHDSREEVQEKAIEGIINVYIVETGGFITVLKQFVENVNPFSDDYNPLVVEPFVPVSQDAIHALTELLSWHIPQIRKDAAIALGILQARSALPAMQGALSRETSDGVKVELIRAFYKIGDPEAGRAIIPSIMDPGKKVHDEAIFALGRLRVTEAAPQMKQLYESGVQERRTVLGFVPVSGNDDLQKKLLEALAYIGDSSCVELFLNALTDPRESYRLYAAEGLGRIGDTSYLAEVGRQYLREDSGKVKLALNYSLYNLGREEHLIELVENLDRDQVYYYLLEMDAGEVPKLYPYLRESDHSIRMRLLDIVGLRGDPSALSIVQELAGSPNAELASAANLALRRIEGRSASD